MITMANVNPDSMMEEIYDIFDAFLDGNTDKSKIIDELDKHDVKVYEVLNQIALKSKIDFYRGLSIWAIGELKNDQGLERLRKTAFLMKTKMLDYLL